MAMSRKVFLMAGSSALLVRAAPSEQIVVGVIGSGGRRGRRHWALPRLVAGRVAPAVCVVNRQGRDPSNSAQQEGLPYKAWTRQHAAIQIASGDLVSDSGAEIYSALRQRGIHTLLVMGVHTNMCVLNRSFAIKQMTKWGIRCILVRDLTDSMYDPQDRPFVSHEQGTELVIQHIEKYWAPSILSEQLVRRLQAR